MDFSQIEKENGHDVMQDGLFVEDVDQWAVIFVSIGDCKVRCYF